MRFAAIALLIAGGAVMASILAAGIDFLKRERAPRQDGEVLLEALAVVPAWLPLLVGAVLGLWALVAPVWYVPWLLLSLVYWPRANRALLRVREDALEHLPAVAIGDAGRAGPLWTKEPMFRVAAADVRALAWDGFDNIGISLRDGSVVTVNCRFFLREEDREPARRAILAFVERACGVAYVPAEAPLDVAPWVVGRRARASG